MKIKCRPAKQEPNVLLQEIAEPLSDLKQGLVELRQSRTLKCVLSSLLAVGNFLNGTEVS